ncbi:MAG: protein kinase, partial [Planctomycetes bacterium]|nr:protein kinase [Planctomycetota bacterium]
MNPERTAVSDHLSAEQAAGVDRACDAFEQAWKAAQATGTSPAIARFLEGCGTIERPVLLRELMALDRAYRQRYGLPIRPEDYRDLAVATGTPIPANAGTDQAAAGVSAPDAPKPLAPGTVVDHYRVLERLGGGGMGVVYKAHDPHLGRTVALKFLSPAQAGDPQQLERFEREARAASALNHPAICTIHASGNHQGQPYLVMEWIDGQTLRTLTGRPLPLDLLARLGRQAAQALAVAHAAGIVHRDIKPDNLMVRSDGYLKVLDFGLARLLPASPVSRPAGADTEPGTLLGTVRYMSPEQARAEPAGSAADVFALGVVLYELATGHHPFPGDSQVEVLNAILYQTPLPPSRLHPDISVALEGLLEQMLAKDAHLRPMAAEVATALAELAGSGAGPSTARAARSTVGRAAELSQLRQGWQSAAGGQGLVLCVTGEAGLGKTTLVEDFLAELAERGPLASVGRGRCSERLAGTEAYLPIVEALEDLLRGDGSERAARLLKLLAPTWYVHVAPQAAADASLERLRKEAQTSSQERLKRELLAFVQELTRLRPLLLFLDDLHWADMSTVDLLAYLGQRCAGLRLLVLLTYRPTELRRGPHPFLPVQRELQGRGVCREIALSFLERADIDRYLALTFPGHAFPAELVALLHARTGGNPLFLCDLVRYLQDRGVLAETQGRWRLAQAVPDLRRELPASVRSLIEQKIARLDEAGRRLLGTASVQGQEFDAAVAAQVLGLDPAAVEEQCELLASV